jgi:hypothetical protein
MWLVRVMPHVHEAQRVARRADRHAAGGEHEVRRTPREAERAVRRIVGDREREHEDAERRER